MLTQPGPAGHLQDFFIVVVCWLVLDQLLHVHPQNNLAQLLPRCNRKPNCY